MDMRIYVYSCFYKKSACFPYPELKAKVKLI